MPDLSPEDMDLARDLANDHEVSPELREALKKALPQNRPVIEGVAGGAKFAPQEKPKSAAIVDDVAGGAKFAPRPQGNSIADFRDEGNYALGKGGSVAPRRATGKAVPRSPERTKPVMLERDEELPQTESAVDVGMWAPPRALTTADAWPRDMGGNLEIYHDPSPEHFRRFAMDKREELLRAGAKAQLELQMIPAMAWAPEESAKRIAAIDAAKKAEGLDVSKLDAKSPEYKQFSDQMWRDYVGQRTPDMGPVRRLSQWHEGPTEFSAATGPLIEEGKAKVMSAAAGALDASTWGLGAGAREAGMEAAQPGSGRLMTDLQEGRPWSSAVGGGVAAVANPLAGAGLLGRGLYAVGRRVGGRLLGALAAGAGTAVAEGAGRDVSLDAADGGNRADSLAPNTALRAGVGAAGGAAGEGVANLGRAAMPWLSKMAQRISGRPVLEVAEQAGFKYDPVRGIIETPQSQELQKQALRSGYETPENYVASRAAPVIRDKVVAADRSLQSKIAGQNEQAFADFDAGTGETQPRVTWSQLLDTARGGARDTAGSPVYRDVSRDIGKMSEATIVPPVGPEAPGTARITGNMAKEYGLDVEHLDPGSQQLLRYRDWVKRNLGVDMETVPASDWAALLKDAPDLPLPNRIPDDVMLELSPRKMSLRELESTRRSYSTAAAAKEAHPDLAKVHGELEAAAIADRPDFPTQGRSYRALKGEQEAAIGEQTRSQQLTGVRSDEFHADARKTPDVLAETNRKIRSIGQANMDPEVRAELKKLAPPQVRKELETLEALQLVEQTTRPKNMALRHAALRLMPGGDVLSGAVPYRSAGLAQSASRELPDLPVSDELYRWVNSRIPRSTMFLPGMNMAQVVADEDARMRRPKRMSDFTQEQQQLLQGLLQ